MNTADADVVDMANRLFKQLPVLGAWFQEEIEAGADPYDIARACVGALGLMVVPIGPVFEAIFDDPHYATKAPFASDPAYKPGGGAVIVAEWLRQYLLLLQQTTGTRQ